MSGLITFESSSVALKISLPNRYEHDGQFNETSIRIDSLADPNAYFARRACPMGYIELSVLRFTDYFSFDPDVAFVYNAPDRSEAGDYDYELVDGTTRASFGAYTSVPAALNDAAAAGTTAAIVIVVLIVVAVAVGVAFVFRRKLMFWHRAAAE